MWYGGGGNGGGVDFLPCLDLVLSPLFVTFLRHLPADDLFLVLSAPGGVVETVWVSCGLGCWICFNSVYILCPTYTNLISLFSYSSSSSNLNWFINVDQQKLVYTSVWMFKKQDKQ